MQVPTSRAAKRCCGGLHASARARSACSRPAALPTSMSYANRKIPFSQTAPNWRSSARRPPPPPGPEKDNGAPLAGAHTGGGGEPVGFGAVPDDEAALEKTVRDA